MLSLAACDDSFNDWADLKTATEPTAENAYGLSFAGSGLDIDMNSESNPDSIDIVTVTSASDGVSSVVIKNITVNGATIPYQVVGNKARVGVAALDSVGTITLQSQKTEKRALTVAVDAAGVLSDGSAFSTSGTVTQNETPIQTPAEDTNGYYMLGDVSGNGWDATSPLWMTKTADGVYKLTVTTTGDADHWYKFYEGSHFESGNWDEINQGQLGCAVNGDNALFNYVKWTDVQTPVIHGEGTWIVTLDVNTWTYSIAQPVLYMAGDANGWTQNEMLTSNDGVNYTGFMYLNNNGFKFCTEKSWDGTNYGAGFSTAGDAANMTLPDGYEAGYYKVDLNLDAKTMTLTAITTIGIIGDATAGGWDSDTDMTYNTTDHTWVINDVTLKAGELKFRANDAWDINWGGTEDNLTQGGANIKIADDGTYDIVLHALADGQATCTITKK